MLGMYLMKQTQVIMVLARTQDHNGRLLKQGELGQEFLFIQ